MKFSEALASLERRGKTAQATQLKQRVTVHFEGLLTEEQILQLPIEELTGILEVFNEIYPKNQPQQSNALEAHIAELQSCGHVVIYGAGYRGKR